MGAAPRRQEYIPAMEREQAAKQGNDFVFPDIAGTHISNVYEHQRRQEQGYGSCGVKCHIPVYGQSHIHNEQNGVCKKKKIKYHMLFHIRPPFFTLYYTIYLRAYKKESLHDFYFVKNAYETAGHERAAVSYSFYFVRTDLQQVWTVMQ